MKRPFLLAATLMIFLPILQSQTFNYEDIKFKYTLPPKTPFTTPFRTITVRFHGDDQLKKYGITPTELQNAEFKFRKFNNIPEHGDLHLDVFVGQPEYLGVKQESQTRKENNVDVIYYFYRGSVITPLSYELRDGARNLIEEKIVYSASDHLTFTSDSYTSPDVLEKTWAQGQNITITKKTTEVLRFALGETARTVRDRYDEQVIEDKMNLFDIKKPEKIQAEFLNTAFAKVTSGLAQNMVLSDWDEAKKSEIKDLLMKGTTFSTEDNNERIAYAIAHYNLAALNLYWNDVAATKMHIKKGKIADRKIYEFEQLEKRIPTMEGRGVSDAVSSKAYTATYEEGADSKLPALNAKGGTSGSTVMMDKSRAVDTVYARNGDIIIGYSTCVHKMRKMGEDQMHDFTHLIINPLNMPQEEINVTYDQIIYMKHKGQYLIPLPTNIATAIIPPIHLYEPVKVSNDQKLALMRTAYHESMPYELSASDMRAYLYTYKDKKDNDEEYEILAVSGGSRYILGLNGALAKDFELCPTIVSRAKNKEYKLEEALLSSLVVDYDGCVK